ncbi:response regulator [Halopiger goleimassiliensis]|uniref:response regulator n=1 Tax=Halopiger goleimassiliensis TaxID=1293048 RepID=UPI000678104D|nr:response regulator [Halopiger goleimassiliensis]
MTAPQRSESKELLLVQSDPGEICRLEAAFDDVETPTTIHAATDGFEAIRFLKERATVDPPSAPDLVLLDLHLPGKDGCEVLEAIRAEPQLRRLPVIVFTEANETEAVTRCYDAYANAYVPKPTDTQEYEWVAKTIDEFWFGCVRLPPVS